MSVFHQVRILLKRKLEASPNFAFEIIVRHIETVTEITHSEIRQMINLNTVENIVINYTTKMVNEAYFTKEESKRSRFRSRRLHLSRRLICYLHHGRELKEPQSAQIRCANLS